jgi:hypothetical protein
MVNKRVPLNPIQSRGLWPPSPAREYTVLDSDDWWKIAAREHLDPWSLIQFNFQTHVPEEVNWYLEQLVGCRHTKDGRNYAFMGADPTMRKIYLPIVSPPPPPAPVPWPDKLKKLKYEVETSNDPQKERFLCMLSAMENRKDDRVIFWSDIAPDPQWVVPLGVETRFGKGLIDPQWFFEHIKSVRDVDMLPYGSGMPRSDTFVVSFHKFLFETASPSIGVLRDANASFVKTHVMLDRWANVSMGGSSSMPVAYRAIKEFVRLEEATEGSVLNCIVTTGVP